MEKKSQVYQENQALSISNQNKNHNCPSIRFKYDEPWISVKLIDIVDRVTRKNKLLESNRPLTISAQFGLVDQRDFFDKIVASKSLKGYYLLKNGEFAYNKSYSKGYPYGAIKRLDDYDLGAVSTLYICFKPKDINSDFLKEYFETDKWYKEMYMIAVEGARNHGLLNIPVNDFFNTQHRIPKSIEEQKKIGEFLNIVNKKIELLEKTLVLYQRYKTYFLDTLINKNNSPLEKMSNIIRITSSKNKNNENLLVLSINNKLGFISQNDQFENHKVASEDTSNYKIVEKDDFAYNPARINVGSIARLRNYNKGIVSPMYIVFKIDKDKVNLNYFENYIDSYDFRLNVLKRLEGSVRLVLSAEALKNMMIPLPNLNEQEKIGNFLEYNNKRIQLTNKKLDELKEYKKGLLQKMFC